jgi:hypothetical protein|uniref:Bifunctional inhibitor/plant lipid transfer protein/seed storage helical domain-containing protein n=1 Tax=Zea mays TaxID=4577 RepID=A0A804PQB3_MAIZE
MLIPKNLLATLLFLLALTALASLDTASSGCCGETCTDKQKRQILQACGSYIVAMAATASAGRSLPLPPPPRNGPCCAAVRALQRHGAGMMQCVVDLLTDAESRRYDAAAMLRLTRYCI